LLGEVAFLQARRDTVYGAVARVSGTLSLCRSIGTAPHRSHVSHASLANIPDCEAEASTAC
jgi:hypothetical protein